MKLFTTKLIIGLLVTTLHLGSTAKAQQKSTMENTLTPKQESIVTIASFTAKGDQPSLRIALNNGLDAGLTINEVKEVLVQLYAYAGFPRSLNAINTFMAVLEERKAKGIRDILGREATPVKNTANKYQQGKKTLQTLTSVEEKELKGANAFAPVIDTFLKEHLFADIFGRDNLDYQSREIATISALSSLSGTESQLQGHLNIGKNIGLSEQQLRGLAATLSAKVGRQEGATATSILDKMFSAASPEVNALANGNTNIVAKGNPGPKENFTGTVFANIAVTPKDGLEAVVGKVTFEPKARTNWHSHPTGQILVISQGVGYYQEKGKPIQIIREGDVIKIPVNAEHWHGASHESSMVHLAIVPGNPSVSTHWLKPVTDEEYNSALSK